MQELRARLRAVENDVTTPGGRGAELAHRLQATEPEVREARLAARAYSAMSMDSPCGDRGADTLGDTVSDLLAMARDDAGAVDECMALAQVSADLSPGDRWILGLRFWHEATQAEIAADLGISQMQVSRLLSAVLRRLRERLEVGDPSPYGAGASSRAA